MTPLCRNVTGHGAYPTGVCEIEESRAVWRQAGYSAHRTATIQYGSRAAAKRVLEASHRRKAEGTVGVARSAMAPGRGGGGDEPAMTTATADQEGWFAADTRDVASESAKSRAELRTAVHVESSRRLLGAFVNGVTPQPRLIAAWLAHRLTVT